MTHETTGDSPADTSTVTESPVAHPPEIQMLLERIDEVSTLPQIAMRVLDVAQDSNAGVGDLRAIVECDPSLSARVLRCVNSAAYGLRFHVSNLQQGISFLGFDQVRNLAVTASVSDVFKDNRPIGCYQRSLLWRHMLCVALGARLIAMRQRFDNFDDAFLAGLLHDIGIVLEDQYCHQEFCTLVRSLREGGSLCDTEQRVFGFDHTMLGYAIGETWRFPPAVCDTIRFHHDACDYKGDHGRVLCCVQVANLLCTLNGITSVGRRLLSIPHGAVNTLQLSKRDMRVLADDLDHEIKANEDLLSI